MARLPIYDPARSFDSTSLTGSYQDLGSVLESAAYGFVIFNDSDVSVQSSFDDGATNGPVIPAGGSFSDNRDNWDGRSEDSRYCLPGGAQVQVKQVTGAGTSGDIIFNVKRF